MRQPVILPCRLAAVLVALSACGLSAAAPGELAVRARVTALEPDVPVRIKWRWGGEGLGGEVVSGELTAVPAVEGQPAPAAGDGVTVEEGKGVRYLWLRRGAWSPAVPVSSFGGKSRLLFLTVTLLQQGEGVKGRAPAQPLRNVVMEFEFTRDGQVVRRFTEKGPDGPSVGIVIPRSEPGEAAKPGAALPAEPLGLLEYASSRAASLEALPWAGQSLPQRFGILTDCGGYKPGVGYGARTTDKDVVFAECRTLRQLGVNGLRSAPDFLMQMVRDGSGIGPRFRRVRIGSAPGYPVPSFRKDRPDLLEPGAGCPYYPGRQAGLEALAAAQVEAIMTNGVRDLPVDEVWALTVDEIGSVFDRAPEGKEHQGACPYCREAFREFVKGCGLTLEDFGAPSWDDIRSTYGYWTKTREEQQREKAAARPAGAADADAAAAVDLTDAQAKKAAAAAAKPAAPGAVSPEQKHRLSERGWGLLHYYSRLFNNYSSARLFTPLRDAVERENAKKRAALARGETDTQAARQPWVYTYALRGNTFLLGGHSLDFFEFYRHADNGFMYETSNRDPRVWEWDSYLCDVGRILQEKMGKRFGIYIKPHRGAPIQRAITAAAKGAKVIYWYTYGPDWVKGDSFSSSPVALADTTRAARLLAAAEDVLYDGAPAHRAEVAVVRPRTSEFWESPASWENGKWVYEALVHAHLPVDPLDEGFLLTEDLSPYKAIYVSGSHIHAKAAGRLAKYVEDGGVLYTSGWGLARDEADQPLEALRPVLGLKSRGAPELWCEVKRYGAGRLEPFKPLSTNAPAVRVAGAAPLGGEFGLAVGREVLDPAEGTEVLARYSDGGAAATRHRHGKGQAVVVGFYAGLEYAAGVLGEEFDMSAGFDAAKRQFVALPALQAGAVRPVDASSPLVEGALIANGARRAVTLVNWAYRGRELVPQENVSVVVRLERKPGRIRSAATGKELPVAVEESGGIIVTVPRLEEADVLLIE